MQVVLIWTSLFELFGIIWPGTRTKRRTYCACVSSIINIKTMLFGGYRPQNTTHYSLVRSVHNVLILVTPHPIPTQRIRSQSDAGFLSGCRTSCRSQGCPKRSQWCCLLHHFDGQERKCDLRKMWVPQSLLHCFAFGRHSFVHVYSLLEHPSSAILLGPCQYRN